MLNLNYHPALWNMGSGHPVLLVYIYMGSTHYVLSMGSGHPVLLVYIWVLHTMC